MSESSFSRRLNGRFDFSAAEREKIAVFLGHPMDWVFKEISPPESLQRPKDGIELMTA